MKGLMHENVISTHQKVMKLFYCNILEIFYFEYISVCIKINFILKKHFYPSFKSHLNFDSPIFFFSFIRPMEYFASSLPKQAHKAVFMKLSSYYFICNYL